MMSYPWKFQLSQDYVQVLPPCLKGILQIHREDGDDFEKYTLWLYYSNKQYCWYWFDFERGSIEIVCADSFFFVSMPMLVCGEETSLQHWVVQNGGILGEKLIGD